MSTLPTWNGSEWLSVYRHKKNSGGCGGAPAADILTYHTEVPRQLDIYRHMLAEEVKDNSSANPSQAMPSLAFINNGIKLEERQ